MKYQIVVQFQSISGEDFDRLVSFEQNLAEAFGNSAMVDGHDFGSGEFNIFVLTDNPNAAFEQVQEVLTKQSRQEQVRVAYRELDGEDYTVLWPPNLKEFSVI
jgi:hypothetical protein